MVAFETGQSTRCGILGIPSPYPRTPPVSSRHPPYSGHQPAFSDACGLHHLSIRLGRRRQTATAVLRESRSAHGFTEEEATLRPQTTQGNTVPGWKAPGKCGRSAAAQASCWAVNGSPPAGRGATSRLLHAMASHVRGRKMRESSTMRCRRMAVSKKVGTVVGWVS